VPRRSLAADADIVVFDPTAILGRVSYQGLNHTSAGIRCVIVNGTPDGARRRAVQFWDEAEKLRPECRFVYITHDLSVVATEVQGSSSLDPMTRRRR
jgi:hypothetical protein